MSTEEIEYTTADATEVTPVRRAGRPKGSRNKKTAAAPVAASAASAAAAPAVHHTVTESSCVESGVTSDVACVLECRILELEATVQRQQVEMDLLIRLLGGRLTR